MLLQLAARTVPRGMIQERTSLTFRDMTLNREYNVHYIHVHMKYGCVVRRLLLNKLVFISELMCALLHCV